MLDVKTIQEPGECLKDLSHYCHCGKTQGSDNIPWSRVLLEKLTGFAANQEISRILWNPKVHAFLKIKNVLCVQSIVWHFVRHPVVPYKRQEDILTVSLSTYDIYRQHFS